ncbi:GtrA family protein [Marinicella rhabdoformis]|uniref:GtrA family protein n=1 Tax=Marinicella rhabdoformis TaxID=2580566 RepID=UPI0015D07CD7|nr:GtrA family protein [Marinicella rhabdoformis]
MLIRYGLVGVAATIAHFGTGLLLHEKLGWLAFWAHATGFVGGLLTAYAGHYYFTFKDDQAHQKRFPKFVVSSLTALFLHQGGVYLFVHQWGWDYKTLAGPVLMVSVPVVTFVMAKFWVFAPQKPE